MLASPGFSVTLTVRLAPLALLVLPCVETVKDGLNGRLAQFEASNGLETLVLVGGRGGDGGRCRLWCAVGGVEDEPGTVDQDVDGADVEGDVLQGGR